MGSLTLLNSEQRIGTLINRQSTHQDIQTSNALPVEFHPQIKLVEPLKISLGRLPVLTTKPATEGNYFPVSTPYFDTI